MGVYRCKGNFVIPPVYKYAHEFSEGKAAVTPTTDSKGKKNSKDLFGFINKSNELIIPPVFAGIDVRFSEGLCAVCNNTGYGYIDEKGTLVIPYSFALGEHFSEGLAVAQQNGRNKKYGFINTHGEMVIDPVFHTADSFRNGLASVTIREKKDIKFGYIDINGDYVWEPTS